MIRAILIFMFLSIVSASVVGCASMSSSNTPTANGQFVATYTDRRMFGADQASATQRVLKVAADQCGLPDKVEILNLGTSTGPLGSDPTATLIYKCK